MIDQFILKWCNENNFTPMKVDTISELVYRELGGKE